MRIVFRADASLKTGAGHVMRCLTLLRECKAQGHHAVMVTNDSGISWLKETLASNNVEQISSKFSDLASTEILKTSPDLIVLDSYTFEAEQITNLNKYVPVVMFADGDPRESIPSMFIDQNLGAEKSKWVKESDIPVLAGSKFSLVRPEIIAVKRANPWNFEQRKPRLLVSMGGTDSRAVSEVVASILNSLALEFQARIVVPPEQIEKLTSRFRRNNSLQFISTSRNFETELAVTDVAISAAGTSAWELCTLGIPALFLGIAENQLAGLREISSRRLGYAVDAVGITKTKKDNISGKIQKLLTDEKQRKIFSQNCVAQFDGQGANRIVSQMESIA